MMEIEYQVIKSDTPIPADQLTSQFGVYGWELCSVVEWSDGWLYYFKRTRVIPVYIPPG
jgi:hypothetical protein